MFAQAHIEVIDAAGNTADAVTIVGAGRVFVGLRDNRVYLHADEAANDVALVTHDGSHVSVLVKVANALRRHDAFLAASVELIDEPELHLNPNAVLRFHRTFSRGDLIGSGGTVIRDLARSDFRREAEAIAASPKHAARVHQELAELQAEGKIDAHGNILVRLPLDMQPGSRTDV